MAMAIASSGYHTLKKKPPISTQRVASSPIHADVSKIKGANINLGYGWFAIKTVRY
jgi:hypothetical protein